MRCIIRASECTVLQLIGDNLALVRLNVLPFNHAVGGSTIPQTCQAGKYSCPMFLISWILRFIFQKQCIDTTAVCTNPWPPARNSSPSYLERYCITCLQFCILHERRPDLTSFQHIERPGCSVNIVGECQYLVFLVVYQIQYFYFSISVLYLINSWFCWIIILGYIGPQIAPSIPILAICMDQQHYTLI